MARQYEGRIYLFANELDMKNGGKAVISVEGLKKGTKVEVVDENRNILVDQAGFTDEFPALGVHIYRVSF